jgi:uncharacterized protein YjbJ (UPF0337 family)
VIDVAIANIPCARSSLLLGERPDGAASLARDSGMRFPPNAFLSRSTGNGADMKPSTIDQVQGTLHEVKGDVKEKVGQVTGDADVTNAGQAEKLAGTVQKKVGQVEKVVGQ